MSNVSQSFPDSKGSLFQLDGDGEEGYTVVQNAFIKRFMPSAPGDMVKVYLAGLMRCYGRCGEQFASNETIAREQGLHPRYVAKAWAYWEARGLIRRLPRYLKAPGDYTDYSTTRNVTYRYQTSNLVLFTRNLAALPDKPGDCPVDKAGVPVQASGGMSAQAPRRKRLPLPDTQTDTTLPDKGSVRSGSASRRTEAPWEEVEALVRVLMDATERLLPCEVGNLERTRLSNMILQYGFIDSRNALMEAYEKSVNGKVSMEKVLPYAEGILRNQSEKVAGR